MIIYSKNGVQRCEIKKFTYNGTFLGETFITFSITNEVPIDFSIGDYCSYRGERFELNYIPSKEKVASKNSYGEAFKYDDVKFNFLANELVNCSFLDYVPSGNSLHYNGLSTFTFTGTVNNLADRIKANLDRLYTGDKAWTITVAPNVESKTINVNASNINCFEALSLAKSDFDINFIIRNRTITIGAVGIDAGRTFGYGKGNGLISLKQTVNNDSKIITRLRAFGSTKNIPSRWYNKQINPSTGLPYIPESMYVPSLMLPSFLTNGGDAYIEDSLLNQTSYDGGTAASNNVIYTFDGGNVSVSPNITLDGGNAYSGMSYVDLYGVREGTVHFDGTGDNEEIYPSIKGITAAQLAELGITVTLNAGDNGKLDEVYSATNPTDNGVIPTDGTKLDGTFFVELKDLGFYLSEKLSDGSYKYSSTDGEITLSMTSGNCAARDFVVADNGITKVNTGGIITYKLELKRDEDTDIGMAFPNSTYPILSGDSFVLINIQMPDVWVNIASQKLYNKALEYLSVNNKPKYSYELNIDNIFMANNPSIGGSLKEGDTITFEDLDLPVSNKVIISSLEIKEGESLIPQYAVTLSNNITVSTIQQILNSVNDNQIAIEQTKKDILTYTGRSFADVKETADALALAFNNYSAGITPAYVNTLSLIAGTESQQFRFVDSNTTNTPNIINHGFKWLPDNGYGTLGSDGSKYLQHLTLGITSLTSSSYARNYTEYKFWYLPNQSFVLANYENELRYAYAKCNRNSTEASYVLSTTPYIWDADSSYYYFLVGILNSMKDGSRSYSDVYGYTEILPSRVTTEKVISSNGINYFDLGANKFHLGTSDESSYLDWNNKISGGLKVKGVIAQSQSGDESPIGVYRGAYNNSLVYYVGDIVTYNGSTYICIGNTTAGILPTNVSYWNVYASKGDSITGTGISSVVEHYLATSASSGVTTATVGWTTTIQTIDATKKYLWNYETINYTDSSSVNTEPVIIGTYGDKGVGISSVVEHYLATSANSGVTIGTSGWTTSIQTITSVNKYLWNYETINYTDSTSSNTDPVIIGAYGNAGTSAITVKITGNNIFKYPKNSSTPENLYVTLTMNVQGATASDYNWQYWNGSAWTNFGFYDQSCNIYAETWLNGGTSLKIRGSINSGAYFDEYTLYKLYDGTDTINVILSNESHTVACDNGGVPKAGEIAKAMTVVSVYRGAAKLTFGVTNGWDIDEITYGGANFFQSDDTIQLQSFLNGYSSAWCDITVMIGTLYITKRFSVAKSVDGQTGTTGDYFEYRYAVNGSPTDAPSIVISDAVPTGWSTSMPTQTLVQYTWMTSSKKSSSGTLLTYWSTPIRVTGIHGDIGPAMSYKGNWVNGATYYGSPLLINVTCYSGVYYMSRYDIDGGAFVSSISPDQDSEHWNQFGSSFESVATGLLLAQSAYIENLIVGKLGTSQEPYTARVAISDNGFGIFKNSDDESSLSKSLVGIGSGMTAWDLDKLQTPAIVIRDKQWMGNYSNTSIYYYGDRVHYSNYEYEFIYQWNESEKPHSGILPSNVTYWKYYANERSHGTASTEIGSWGMFLNGSMVQTGILFNSLPPYNTGNATIVALLQNKTDDPEGISSAIIGLDQVYISPTIWASGTSYVIGNKVYYNSKFYNCILATNSALPTNTIYWEEYISSKTYGGYFNTLYAGSIRKSCRRVSTSQTLLRTDSIIHCYNTSQITLTLPVPDKSMIGMELKIRVVGTNTVTISTNSQFPIWYNTTTTNYNINNNDSMILTWDGNYWVTSFMNEGY